MKINFKHITSVALLAAVILLAGCKKGDPGPQGVTGNTGVNGAGYDEAIKNGNIVVYLSGKSPAGGAFKDTIDFKFSSGSVYRNYFYEYSDNESRFDIARFRTFDNTEDDDYVEFSVNYLVESGDTTFYWDTELQASVVPGGMGYFRLDEDYYLSDGSDVDDFIMQRFHYDKTSGILTAGMTYTVPGENNSTGYDLDVTVLINSKVYESEDD